MKTKTFLVLVAALSFFTFNTAQGKITVKAPAKKNLTTNSTCPNKDGINFLDPANLTYLVPPGDKSAIIKELKDGDVKFKNFIFKKGAALKGTLTIDYYHSKFEGIHHSGGQIKARYKKAATDPNNLRWVQLVNSIMPINTPAEKYPIIDPVPEDEPNKTNPDPNKYRPFYWNEEEIASYTGGKTFDLKFYDFSSRTHPPTSIEIWTGDLYISSWDGNTPGTVTLHDGVQWGWVGTCADFSDKNWVKKICGSSVTTPVTTGSDKVTLDYIGARGTIANVITDTPGDITVIDGNSIEIQWSEPLEPNTPINIKFTTDYQPLDFAGGIWSLEGTDVEPITPGDVNLTVTPPPFNTYSLEVVNSTNPASASWPDTGTGYDNGHWYHYPHTDWLTVWFDNGPFDETGTKLIKVKMTIGPLDPNMPYSATIAAGYSSTLWTTLGLDHPPLPEYIPDPMTEPDYIHREEAPPIYSGTGIEPQDIQAEILVSSCNPQWTCVSAIGENLKISFGMTDYSDPYTPTLSRSDFETDGTIDGYDLRFFAQEWLRQGHKYESDINGDGVVNFADYATVAANWKKSVKASNPSPANEEINVPLYDPLSWTPGLDAIHHDVYFGEDSNEVNDANQTNPMSVYMGRQAETEYWVDMLPDMTYFWRIDEVGETESDIEKGNVWNFTTEFMP